MGLKEDIGEKIKDEAKAQVKQVAKKVGMKIATTVLPPVLIIIIIASAFLIVVEKIKDAADSVVSAAGSGANAVVSLFDNTSDTPEVQVKDDLVKQVMYELQTKYDVDMNATYLTGKLIKNSIEAYYATQYPYIDGLDYDNNENLVKGCIHFKRNGEDLKYINYNSFAQMLEGDTEADVEKIKKYFSMDNDQNAVIATWTSSVIEYEDEDGNMQTQTIYSISEHKFEYKKLTSQFAMNYKLPILLANMYSNEGFGLAVANLAKNGLVEITILDNITNAEIETKEYYKMEHAIESVYDWKKDDASQIQTDTAVIKEWEEDNTAEDKPAKTTKETKQTNNIMLAVTNVNTWIARTENEVKVDTSNNGKDTDITGIDVKNEPEDFEEEERITIKEEQIEDSGNESIDKLFKTDPKTKMDIDDVIDKIVEIKEEEYSGEENEDEFDESYIKKMDLVISKRMTDHKVVTKTTYDITNTNSTDIQLVDNTDTFLALIKSDTGESDGKYDPDGKLVEYIKKSKDDEFILEDGYEPPEPVPEENNENNSNENNNGNNNGNSSTGGKESLTGDKFVDSKGRTFYNWKQYNYVSTPPYYKATDNWGSIKNKGCMPSSLSIILSGLGKTSKNGQPYTPKTFVEEIWPGTGGKTTVPSVSSYDGAKRALNKVPGVSVGSQGLTRSANGKNTMLNYLKNGTPLLIHASAGFYTGGGHYMTLLACKGNQVYLSNPGSSSKTGWVDIGTLISRNVDWFTPILSN